MKINRELILILAFLFFVVYTVGWNMNERAVHTNNCTMPLLDKTANYYSLTDIYVINGWAYSVGDFMIYVGFHLFALFGAWYLIKIIIDYRRIEKW